MQTIEILEQQAIDAAITFVWEKAITINKQIIIFEKKNIHAYLRLGFAYLQLQKWNNARKIYNLVLKYQPGNQVAKENLEKIKILSGKKAIKNKKNQLNLNPSLFLEIPGKTKSISLVTLGQKDILAALVVGQEVVLKPRKRKLEVRTLNDEYIGILPDDLSKRLLIFIKAGSIYSALIKESGLNRVVVFIREEKKGKKVKNYLSFSTNIQLPPSEVVSSEVIDENENEETHSNQAIDLDQLADQLTENEEIAHTYSDEDNEEEENE